MEEMNMRRAGLNASRLLLFRDSTDSGDSETNKASIKGGMDLREIAVIYVLALLFVLFFLCVIEGAATLLFSQLLRWLEKKTSYIFFSLSAASTHLKTLRMSAACWSRMALCTLDLFIIHASYYYKFL